MIILTQSRGKSIMIGDNIEIRVTGLYRERDGQLAVRLGITAPREITVNREEIHRRIHGEQQRDGR